MRYSPARMCEEENPGNASAISKCLHNFGEPSWLAFAAVAVIFGAAAIGLAVYCCISRAQERSDAVAHRRRSGSVSPTPSVALLTDQSAIVGRHSRSASVSVGNTHYVSVAPPGGPV